MPAVALSETNARLLVIDGSEALAGYSRSQFGENAVRHVLGMAEATGALSESSYDFILADLNTLDSVAGLAEPPMARLARLGKSALILAVSETGSVSSAVAALQSGAHDCMARPTSPEDLAARLTALHARHDRRSAAFPASRLSPIATHHIIAESTAMQVIVEQLVRIAASPAPVFLSGEAGTGKRLVAEMLHDLGPLSELPFVAVDCRKLLTETGRTDLHHGLAPLAGAEGANAIARAGGGTLYLSEIGALGSAAQSRLLSLVEPAMPGVPSGLPNLRIVCGTRQSPSELLEQRSLRQDLFYRLNVLPIRLPPLRQRQGDVLALAVHFMRGFSRIAGKHFEAFSPGALAYLEAHEWPENVRQIETLIRRAVSGFDGATITPQMLAASEAGTTPQDASPVSRAATEADEILPMWQQEQRIIETAIARYNGNIARAAAALEISPSTIYRKKQSWEERTGNIAGAA